MEDCSSHILESETLLAVDYINSEDIPSQGATGISSLCESRKSRPDGISVFLNP